MAAYRPDPGGVFESDAHRRVLAALPAPEDIAVSLEYAVEPIIADENTPFRVRDADTIVDIQLVVEQLVADGYATYDSETKNVQRTAGGTAELEAPSPDEPPPLEPAEVAEREAANAAKAKTDALRAATGRLEARKVALEELKAAIAEDEKTIEENS